jgi:ribonuclease HIII
MNATFTKMTKGYSLEKQDRWVIREVNSMKKLRAAGHRDFRNLTDSQISGIATKLARFYSVGTTYTPAN